MLEAPIKKITFHFLHHGENANREEESRKAASKQGSQNMDESKVSQVVDQLVGEGRCGRIYSPWEAKANNHGTHALHHWRLDRTKSQNQTKRANVTMGSLGKDDRLARRTIGNAEGERAEDQETTDRIGLHEEQVMSKQKEPARNNEVVR